VLIATIARVGQYLSFLGVVAVAMVVPGPDTLVVLRTSLANGPALGTWAAAGSSAGLLLWGAAAVGGVTALLTVSPAAFLVLKVAGAAYLAALGCQALVATWRGEGFARPLGTNSALTPLGAFRRGLFTDLANVKIGLFWTALAPQFLHAGLGPAMAVSMAVLGFLWLTLYASLAGRLRGPLAGARVGRVVNAGTGVTMVSLAVLVGVAG
jgi:threonine/homoserine/homoserine lactone efflux protein